MYNVTCTCTQSAYPEQLRHLRAADDTYMHTHVHMHMCTHVVDLPRAAAASPRRGCSLSIRRRSPTTSCFSCPTPRPTGTRACTCACTHAHLHTFAHVCVRVHARVHVHVSRPMVPTAAADWHASMHMYMYICPRVRACACAFMCMYPDPWCPPPQLLHRRPAGAAGGCGRPCAPKGR